MLTIGIHFKGFKYNLCPYSGALLVELRVLRRYLYILWEGTRSVELFRMGCLQLSDPAATTPTHTRTLLYSTPFRLKLYARSEERGALATERQSNRAALYIEQYTY